MPERDPQIDSYVTELENNQASLETCLQDDKHNGISDIFENND